MRLGYFIGKKSKPLGMEAAISTFCWTHFPVSASAKKFPSIYLHRPKFAKMLPTGRSMLQKCQVGLGGSLRAGYDDQILQKSAGAHHLRPAFEAMLQGEGVLNVAQSRRGGSMGSNAAETRKRLRIAVAKRFEPALRLSLEAVEAA